MLTPKKVPGPGPFGFGFKGAEQQLQAPGLSSSMGMGMGRSLSDNPALHSSSALPTLARIAFMGSMSVWRCRTRVCWSSRLPLTWESS